jgi:hypothetical protein
MNKRVCPFCREKIHPAAVVCRFCLRNLPEEQRPRSASGGWIAAITLLAVIASGSVIVASEFFRERRNWLK